MAGLRLQYSGGLYLPGLDLWLDPREPRTGPELVFVSHAHSDHVADHREIILTEPTSRLMQARLPGRRLEHVLRFGETRPFGVEERAFKLTLLPAGHIFGSAMALVETKGETLLYTGDFKLRRGLSAEACEPRSADTLIMETTFGLPQYCFPPAAEVLKGVLRFCREALDEDQTPVLFGYSLGKSQELLCSLGDAGLPLMLHSAVWRLTDIYREFGHRFPSCERFDPHSAKGKVLLFPPNAVNSAALRGLGRVRTAILTGWAVDPNCRFRYQCDAAFPLSDHADFPELLEMVRWVNPRQVYTVHGFASAFAQTLREKGYCASALSETEQLGLLLGERAERPRAKGRVPQFIESGSRPLSQPAADMPDAGYKPPGTGTAGRFEEFALTCSRVAGVSGKLEKVRLLSEYLSSLSVPVVGMVATWFSGHPFPASQDRALHLGWAVIRDAVCHEARCDETTFHQVYLKHSDLGSATEEILSPSKPKPGLALEQVQELFTRLHAARGPLAKIPLLAGALDRCSPLAAKYLVKIITGDLRIGLKEGLVEQAIAQAFGRGEEEVRRANLLLGDIGETGYLAAQGRLAHLEMTPFRPIRFMLASPEPTAEAVWNRVSERRAVREMPSGGRQPDESKRPLLSAFSVWLEDKYDGIRAQLHRVGARVEFYSRDLKEITATFPELVDHLRECPADFVLDGEIAAMRGEEVLPFAELQKRLGRRQRDLFMREEVPVVFIAFDLLWENGQTLLDCKLKSRRQALEALVEGTPGLRLARVTHAGSASEIDEAFADARARGNEGLMIKDPESTYTPGRQGLAWLKLKKTFATLDCVVIGAEYGHGRRSQVLSDYTFAVRDERTGGLVTIGKAYTGLTDREIEELTRHFLRTARRQHGRYFEVPPDTVLEIAFDRIQESSRHNSGLALRFPRIVRWRTDKRPDEIDTLATALQLVREPAEQNREAS